MDIREILEYLPHRYPMLLVDRVLECEPGKRLLALKNVTINEPFFTGHFPHYPVMPGVMIIEALAQAAAVLSFRTMNTKPDDKSVYYFAGIDEARFKRPVVPGDQLLLEVTVERSARYDSPDGHRSFRREARPGSIGGAVFDHRRARRDRGGDLDRAARGDRGENAHRSSKSNFRIQFARRTAPGQEIRWGSDRARDRRPQHHPRILHFQLRHRAGHGRHAHRQRQLDHGLRAYRA